jgi:hypothetical protein
MEGTGVRRRVFPVLAFKILHKMVDDTVVKVLATQVSVTNRGFDLKDTVLNSQEEHVKYCSEIKDEYCTISIDSSPRDFFYLSDKSPKTAKIENKLLPLSAKIGCDA